MTIDIIRFYICLLPINSLVNICRQTEPPFSEQLNEHCVIKVHNKYVQVNSISIELDHEIKFPGHIDAAYFILLSCLPEDVDFSYLYLCMCLANHPDIYHRHIKLAMDN